MDNKIVAYKIAYKDYNTSTVITTIIDADTICGDDIVTKLRKLPTPGVDYKFVRYFDVTSEELIKQYETDIEMAEFDKKILAVQFGAEYAQRNYDNLVAHKQKLINKLKGDN